MNKVSAALRLTLASACVLAWSVVVTARMPHSLTRGPFLQNVTATSASVAWSTSDLGESVLRVGRFPGAWDVEKLGPSTDTHLLQLSSLQPATRYYYEIEVGGTVLTSGSSFSFETYPAAKDNRSFRFLAWGDSGNASGSQLDVAEQIDTVQPRPKLVLGLGDLAYPSGGWDDWNPKLFSPYEDLIRNTAFWPTIGNHDIQTQNAAPYLDAFYLPENSGGPGNASGTERYYSFDYGMAHFVSIDFWSSDVSVGGDQYEWMIADMDAAVSRGQRWIIVFAHSPPYTDGSHDSLNEGSLIFVHDNWVPVMEEHGADLVLAGHSHVYERTYLLEDDVVLQSDPSDYTKDPGGPGTLYITSGAGGGGSSGDFEHPLVAVAVGNKAGMSTIDVTYDSLRGYFLDSNGTAHDLFSLHKSTDTTPPRITHIEVSDDNNREVTLAFDEPLTSGAGNPNNYAISGGASILDATLLSDERNVRLDTTTLVAGAPYTVTLGAIKDQASPANTVAANTKGFFLARGGPGADQAPNAVITNDIHTANAPATVRFSSLRSTDPDGSIDLVTWDFGDGSPTSTQPEVTHTFSDVGVYTVNLFVRDDQGNRALDTIEIHVHAEGTAPVAVVSADTTEIEAGESISFDAAGSLDTDGGGISYQWDFGDPGASTFNLSASQTPTRVFETEGTYTVTLQVTDDEGAQASETISVEVGASSNGGNPGTGTDSGGGCVASATGNGDPSFGWALLALALILATGPRASRHHRAAGRRGSA